VSGTALREGAGKDGSDGTVQAFGVSEPNSGTDTLSLQTTATRDGNA
jgi:alkylation response protein AidB-like acyl-CoA dehydrogenase